MQVPSGPIYSDWYFMGSDTQAPSVGLVPALTPGSMLPSCTPTWTPTSPTGGEYSPEPHFPEEASPPASNPEEQPSPAPAAYPTSPSPQPTPSYVTYTSPAPPHSPSTPSGSARSSTSTSGGLSTAATAGIAGGGAALGVAGGWRGHPLLGMCRLAGGRHCARVMRLPLPRQGLTARHVQSARCPPNARQW